jgi:hypothetical protein
MNKQERKLKGYFKFKKRLKNYQITEERLQKYGLKGLYCYKTTGKPCSCAMCSPGKVEEKPKYRIKHKK